MASCLGSKVKVTVDDGSVYTGVLQAIDQRYGRVTLREVMSETSGLKLKGLSHFFKKEIHEIGILEESKVKPTSTKTGGSTVLSKKLNPAHLKNLKDVEREKLFLSSAEKEKDDQKESKTPKKSVNLGPYTVIDKLDQSFKEAVEYLQSCTILGLSGKGVKLGRQGRLCWLCFNSKTDTLLFDVLSLGPECITSGLGDILTAPGIQKIVHDCRRLSDLLYHQYDLRLVNVFDTQVAEAVIQHSITSDWPSYVSGLHVNLFHHLKLDPSLVFVERYKDESQEEVWAVRPPPQDCLEALVKEVLYLRELRLVMMERMMENFVKGVDIYLTCITNVQSDPAAEKLQNICQKLPSEFSGLGGGARRGRSRGRDPEAYDGDGFYLNCYGGMDPQIRFSHDGVQHRGDGQLPKSNAMENGERHYGRRSSREEQRRSDSRDSGRRSDSGGRRSRSASRGRRSSGSEPESVLGVASAEMAGRHQKVVDSSPVAAYREDPGDVFSAIPSQRPPRETAPCPTSPDLPRIVTQPVEYNFIASGSESRSCMPKMSERIPEVKRSPITMVGKSYGEDSGGEFDIIRIHPERDERPKLQSRLPRTAQLSDTEGPSPAKVNNHSPTKPVQFQPNKSSPLLKSSSSKTSPPGRGQYLQAVKGETVRSPGGLQSLADNPESSREPGPDVNGAVSLGRGRLMQRYEELK